MMTPKRLYIDFTIPIDKWADDNKDIIMDSIYENVFDFMESEEDDRVVLKVSPEIQKVKPTPRRMSMLAPPVDVDFIISKDDIDLTLHKMLEHYVSTEEYEKCAKIHKLQNELDEIKHKPKKETFW